MSNKKAVIIVVFFLFCILAGVFCLTGKKEKQDHEPAHNKEHAEDGTADSVSWEDLDSYEQDSDTGNPTNHSEQSGMSEDTAGNHNNLLENAGDDSEGDTGLSESGTDIQKDNNDSVEDMLSTGDDVTDKYGPIRQ